MSEIQKIETRPSEISTVIAAIERMAVNPDVDAEKMLKLLEMQERIMAKQAEMLFNQALGRVQKVLPVVTKHGKIEFTDKNGKQRETPFARYEDIDEVIRPLLLNEGFSISFNSEWNDSALVSGTLSHIGGHSKTSTLRLPLDTSGSKNNLQAMGSTISYGKRYLVGMLLNIITKDEDNDGKDFDTIALTEAVVIDELITETKSDKGKFLKYMGVKDVREIQAKDIKKAMNALNTKKKQDIK